MNEEKNLQHQSSEKKSRNNLLFGGSSLILSLLVVSMLATYKTKKPSTPTPNLVLAEKWSKEYFLNILTENAIKERLIITGKGLKQFNIQADLSAQRRKILLLAEDFIKSFKNGDINDFKTFELAIKKLEPNLLKSILAFDKILEDNNLEISEDFCIDSLKRYLNVSIVIYETLKEEENPTFNKSSPFQKEFEFILDKLFATKDYELVEFINTE